jgi:glycosyltransferase involved in cell wall biosynthesis
MYPPQHLGGYELIWQDAVRLLRAHGHTVRVLASDLVLPGREGAREADRGVHRELRRYWEGDRYPHMSPRARLRLERANAATFDRQVRELRPDAVCWFNMGGLSLSLLERARRAALPAVAYVADDWPVDGPRLDGWSRAFASRPRAARAADRLTRIPARLDLDRAARWLLISDATRRNARAAGWALPGAAIAHAGVGPEFRAPPGERPPWRGRLLYAGRVVADKGVDLAVAALAQLPEETTLTIAGPDGAPGDVAALRAQIDQLQVGHRIARRPPLDRRALARAYAKADAVLFPSRWAEPWGLVGLEAMACGTPVVASGTGGSAEYLDNGENALVVPQLEAPAWAAAIRLLAQDDNLRDRLREGGLRTAAAHPADMAPAAIARALEDIVGPAVPKTIKETA